MVCSKSSDGSSGLLGGTCVTNVTIAVLGQSLGPWYIWVGTYGSGWAGLSIGLLRSCVGAVSSGQLGRVVLRLLNCVLGSRTVLRLLDSVHGHWKQHAGGQSSGPQAVGAMAVVAHGTGPP